VAFLSTSWLGTDNYSILLCPAWKVEMIEAFYILGGFFVNPISLPKAFCPFICLNEYTTIHLRKYRLTGAFKRV